ncbi:MAG: carbonic anhydrase [Desulfobulbaceae bacterium]|nr:carbonic anhydrase [Desulfobulbaceae bacterium]
MKKVLKNAFLALSFSAMLAAAPLAMAADHGEAHGGGHGAAAAQPEIPASVIMREVIEGNEKFKMNHESKYFDLFQDSQVPVLTVVTCSDSRVHTNLFGIVPDNNIFVVRNIGNQVANSEGSVDYGVMHLPTKILMILGHSSCGAVKAAMGDYSGEAPAIKKELDPLKPVIALDDQSGEFKERWAKNVERNVDYQVNYSMKLYDEKVSHGDLVVVGAVYDFNDIYGQGRGSLIITNINGEKSPNKIMEHPVLKDLTRGPIVTHVSSRAQ